MAAPEDAARAAVNATIFAVVGASNDREKYGNIIYRDLREAGFTVYPVNPNTTEVEGDGAYSRLQDLPDIPEVADIVVPSLVGESIADDAAEVGVKYFWLQPGAESDALVEYAESLGLNVIHDQCIMVARRLYRK